MTEKTKRSVCEAIIRSLQGDGAKPHWPDSRAWTRFASNAVVDALAEFRLNGNCKGREDCHGGQEYLSLDVTAFHDVNKYAPPAVACELENRCQYQYREYSLWKLLCVQADLRILVTYFYRGSKTTDWACDSSAELVGRLADVVGSNFPHNTALLIIGDGYGEGPQFDLYQMTGKDVAPVLLRA